LGVGHELPVDRVGDPALQAAQGFQWGLGLGELAAVVGAALGVVADLDDRGDVDDVFMRRFPARESRCRICSPEEASRGAVPVRDAK
jgi:hypothetical protein